MALEDVHKRFGATRALDGAGITLVRRGGARARRRERRRQVDADQDDDGDPPARRGRRSRSTASETTLTSSAEAQPHGIVAIYQEPMIFPDLSVAENIFIGHRRRGHVVRWRRMYDEADEHPALARHRRRRPRPGQHAHRRRAAGRRDRQGDLARRPRADHGRTDGVAVGARGRPAVRPGRPSCAGAASPCCSSATVSTRCSASPIASPCSATAGTSRRDSSPRRTTSCSSGRWSAGTSTTSSCAPATSPDATVLRVEGLCRAGTFEDVSFEVRAGEVVGFAGLVGAGRTDVGLALFGIAPAERGHDHGRRQARARSAALATPCASGSPTSPRTAAARVVDAAVGHVEHHAAGDRHVPNAVRPRRPRRRGRRRRPRSASA